MKKTKNIVRILLIIILIITLHNSAFATIDTNITIGGTTAIHSSDNMIKKLLGVFQFVGSVISVLALAILGIRYMLSSVDEQAKMKGVIGYYVAGAVLVFATSNVLSIIYNIISGIN